MSQKRHKNRRPVHEGPAGHIKKRSLLFVWVEGGTDAKFFDVVLKTLLGKKYNRVVIRTYASMKRDKFSAILEAIKAMGRTISSSQITTARSASRPKRNGCTSTSRDWNGNGSGLLLRRSKAGMPRSWTSRGLRNSGCPFWRLCRKCFLVHSN